MHTQSNNKTKCLKQILLAVKTPTPHDAHLLALSYITNLSYTHTTSLSHVTQVQHHSIPYTHHTVPLRPHGILLTQTHVQINIRAHTHAHTHSTVVHNSCSSVKAVCTCLLSKCRCSKGPEDTTAKEGSFTRYYSMGHCPSL